VTLIFANPDTTPQARLFPSPKGIFPSWGSWGALSKAAIHANLYSYGPSEEIRDGELVRVIKIGDREANPRSEKRLLLSVRLVGSLVLRAAELILLDNGPESGRTFQRIAGGNMAYYAPTQETIARLYSEFQTLEPDEQG
jgi:hypothetical protein